MPGPAWGSRRDILKPSFVTRILVSFLWASELLYSVAEWLTIRYVKYEEEIMKKTDCSNQVYQDEANV